jgi:hypothetical protein
MRTIVALAAALLIGLSGCQTPSANVTPSGKPIGARSKTFNLGDHSVRRQDGIPAVALVNATGTFVETEEKLLFVFDSDQKIISKKERVAARGMNLSVDSSRLSATTVHLGLTC